MSFATFPKETKNGVIIESWCTVNDVALLSL